MNESTINLNDAKCIQSMTNWGESVIYNICSGTNTHLPWGTMDYIGTLFLIAIGVAFLGMIGAMILAVIFD